MSGIFGLFDASGATDFTGALRTISGCRTPDAPQRQIESATLPHGLIGRTHHAIFAQPPIDLSPETTPLLVTSGYCVSETKAEREDPPGWSRGRTEQVRRILMENHLSDLARLNGVFQVAAVGADGREVRLFSDRHALAALYICHRGPILAFAPEIDLLLSLLASTESDARDEAFALDRQALAEWLEIGMVTGERTLLRGVAILPRGACLTWSAGIIKMQSYWRMATVDDGGAFCREDTAAQIDIALRQALRRIIRRNPAVALSLSGGMDSRLLLAAARAERLPVVSFTFGPEGSDDHRIAARVARSLGVLHNPLHDTAVGSGKVFTSGVRRSGGMTNVLDMWGLQHGRDIRRLAGCAINGLGGNDLLGFLAFDLLRFLVPRDDLYVARWLCGKFDPGWRQDDLTMIRTALAPATPGPALRLAAQWTRSPGDTPEKRIYDFHAHEVTRRANLLGVALDDLYIEPLAPFFDNDLMDILRRIPPREKRLARFYRYLFRRYYPDMAAIPYNRTGQPVGVSTTRLCAGKLINRLTRPPCLNPWGDWLRHDLREYTGDLLLAGDTRLGLLTSQGFVRGGVTRLFAGDDAGVVAVGRVLTAELFLREFRPTTG